jgi:hypothetical protein
MMAVLACSGGEKIVGASGNAGPAVFTAEDSVFLANLMVSQTLTSFRNLRLNSVTDVYSLVGGTLPAGCNAAVSGTGDTNGNGIAQDQTLTFTAQNCSVTQSGATTRIVGSVRVQELDGLRGYRATFTNFQNQVVLADTTATATITGALEVVWSSATAARVQNTVTLRIAQQHPRGQASLTLGTSLSGSFTPSAGQLVAGRNLPAGTFSATGSVSATIAASGTFLTQGQPSTATYNVSVSSPVNMTYDGTCTHTRAFAAGQLRGGVSGYAPGSVSAGFSGCGQGVTPPPGVKR